MTVLQRVGGKAEGNRLKREVLEKKKKALKPFDFKAF